MSYAELHRAEVALLHAQEALDRPEVARQLGELLDAGLPLVDERGHALGYDLGELLLALDVPGNVGLCQRRLADTRRWYTQHPPVEGGA